MADQGSAVLKGDTSQPQGRRLCERQSIGIIHTRSHCPTSRLPHQGMVQLCKCLRSSTTTTWECPSYTCKNLPTAACETLEAKAAFEASSNTFGVQISHYHAGRFAEWAFLSHCDSEGQTVSFAGINADHQNGIVEKHIQDLQDMARTMLVHAKKKWPKAVTPHLWPYAL